ncbi:acyl-CoA dehydrogenase [Corallococcus sp. H22C18031201]|uniref:acyl-CoA dehydrogenase family protein n=1 Tax=Citreicoccus inhibens TaxID=2849499 RepID=UPI000E71E5F4|nr:acyl-CoA dehydrogenase family protein [Citreicoccus inhibens]MBU8895176.1 acyl-CoA/acyl-ACP dehydrogenase [Citreicoccus inhibens]RJS27315.1 acyl-CoA dehydrogenase [Corallococcus sp. H22C18031201]
MTTVTAQEGAAPVGPRPLETVARIASEVARVHADSVDREGRFPAEAIEALKRARMLGVLVPASLGGPELGLDEVAAMCEALAHHCASTAMIFAMHHIQVACLVRHGQSSPLLRAYLTELNERQALIASVTSEVGVGGEMRASVTCVEQRDGRFTLDKDATTISYGEHADDLLATARRAPDAPRSDQVAVLLRKGDFTLERTSAWDTLGMRGTCSPGAKVRSSGPAEQVLPVPFADIASQTMVPVSHVLWSSVWLGIAAGAVGRARAFVRQQARARPGTTPPTAVRLAEVHNQLQTLRASVHEVSSDAGRRMAAGDPEALSSIGFSLKMNNLKVSASQLVVDIVHRALLICGIQGYKNDSPFSLGRHLRDAHSAALMIGNDRILATNASLLLVLKDE